MKDVLGANACPVVIPIGAEESFKGVVDLIKMKAILWHDETMGADYSVEEIPANLVDEANEWREKMLEKVAEFDDALMEKFFDDPSTITEEEILRALRAGTLKWISFRCSAALHSRIREFRHCLTMFVRSCLLRWIHLLL